jgi:hypothetical protein
MIYTDKIVTNRFIQELLDSRNYTAEQIDEIHNLGLKIFAIGYDIGRTENPTFKPVLQCDKHLGKVIEEHRSILNASKKTGIEVKNISAVVNGKKHTAGGYAWRFKNLNDYKL